MNIVVTGGAGYIGAHLVRLLAEQDPASNITVIDDLSFGAASRLPKQVELAQIDLADPHSLPALIELLKPADAVIHVAARKQVGESVARPAWYYQQNVGGMANLLLAMEQTGTAKLVFSSSAATYGEPDTPTVTEDAPLNPINPYGQTKVIGEWLAQAAGKAWGLRHVSLRYFNVAGSGAPDLGDPALLNLVPMVFDRLANGQRPKIFGQDYPTPDGTCVRDYIHVADLASAHAAALAYLNTPLTETTQTVFNVGTGQGASVSQVIDAIGRASGLDTTPEMCPRRPGDPPYLVGDPSRIAQTLGWRARYNLDDIVISAWQAWQAGPRHIPVP